MLLALASDRYRFWYCRASVTSQGTGPVKRGSTATPSASAADVAQPEAPRSSPLTTRLAPCGPPAPRPGRRKRFVRRLRRRHGPDVTRREGSGASREL